MQSRFCESSTFASLVRSAYILLVVSSDIFGYLLIIFLPPSVESHCRISSSVKRGLTQRSQAFLIGITTVQSGSCSIILRRRASAWLQPDKLILNRVEAFFLALPFFLDSSAGEAQSLVSSSSSNFWAAAPSVAA